MEPTPPPENRPPVSSFPDLRRNLAITKAVMAAAVPDKQLGRPTGLCEPILLSVLGAHVDFKRVQPLDISRYKDETGLSGYPVIVDNKALTGVAVKTILEQDSSPVRVLYLSGKINFEGRNVDETHIIGVVKGPAGKYAVIDSLHPEGLEELDDLDAVVERVDGRFDMFPRKPNLSVVFTDEEKLARQARGSRNQPRSVGNGVTI